MFKRKHTKVRTPSPFSAILNSPFTFEGLEGRQLLSGGGHHGGGGGGGGPGGFGGGGPGGSSTIAFSLAPGVVQTGLDNLAATDGVTAPTSTSSVILGNTNGVETYTVDVKGTGTDTKLTVDASGNPVTAATKTSTTYGAVTNTAVTGEITAIATALGLTAPTSTTAVSVSTPTTGLATYTVTLASSTTTTGRNRGTTITVDANGNPVGNEKVPLSTLSTAIQSGLTTNAPSGATALASTSLINVQTTNGVTTYSATYTSTGTRTTVTVNSAGSLANLPSNSTTTFSALTTAEQTELQALATADGAGTIAATQSVTAYDEANGTIIYAVKVTATDSTTSDTYTVTLAVDQLGNPTVLPGRGGDGGGGGPGGGNCGPGGGPGSTGSTTTGTTTTTTASSAARKRR